MTTAMIPPDMTMARCNDTSTADLFFPATGRSNAKQRRDAKAVCNGRVGQNPCVVRESCLLWAVAQREDDGIWGGMTPRERRQFREGTATRTMGVRSPRRRSRCR